MTTPHVDGLRVVSSRIAACSAKQLPRTVAHIANALLGCRDALCQSEQPTKHSTSATSLQKFKTQLNALLNARDHESRWAAVVLIKACLDVGGSAVIHLSRPAWVPGLLKIILTSGPASAKVLSIITLTKLFLLLDASQTLVRELVTPSLPIFLRNCLSLIDFGKSPSVSAAQIKTAQTTLPAILESFRTLLPQHPTIFRTFESQLQGLLGPLTSPTPSSLPFQARNIHNYLNINSEVVQSAGKLLVAFHFCAPKQTTSEKWSETLDLYIKATHSTANVVFRSVIEDWQPLADNNTTIHPKPGNSTYNSAPTMEQSDDLNLSAWAGIDAGCERLADLVGIINHHVAEVSATPIAFPIGALYDLITRALSVASPAPNVDREGFGGPRINNQITRDEREKLWVQLPRIHIAILELVEVIIKRLAGSVLSFSEPILDQIVWIFDQEGQNAALRVASYRTLHSLVEIHGNSLTKQQMDKLIPLVQRSCLDILPVSETKVLKKKDPMMNITLDQEQASKGNSDGALTLSLSQIRDLLSSAQLLLTTVFSKVPAEVIPGRLRSTMDRAAILVNDSDAMLASVLNPPPETLLSKTHSSILPFLSRQAPTSVAIESMLRPRMPPIFGASVSLKREADEGSLSPEISPYVPDSNPNPVFAFSSQNHEDPYPFVLQTRSFGGSDSNFETENTQMEPAATSRLPQPSSKQATNETDRSDVEEQTPSGIVRKRSMSSTDSIVEEETKRARVTMPVQTPVHMPLEHGTSHAEAAQTTQLKGEPALESLSNNDLPKQRTTHAKGGADTDSDDDDFVIPELTLATDTDDDEEMDEDAVHDVEDSTKLSPV